MNCVSTLQQTFKRIMMLQYNFGSLFSEGNIFLQNIANYLPDCYVIKQIAESSPLYIMLFTLQPFFEFLYQLSMCWTAWQRRNINRTTHLHTIYVFVHSVRHEYKWAHQTVVSQ